MGIGVSGWRLARAVALTGQLGVVSGTALAHVLVRRLEAESLDHGLSRAMARFPFPDVVDRVLARYRRARRSRPRGAFSLIPMYTLRSPAHLTELTVLANFVEIALAKDGHDGPVGINLLEKVQLPNLPSLYGAMLAGVDYVLMGAGVPRAIPAVLDRLARSSRSAWRSRSSAATTTSSPSIRARCSDADQPPLRRPHFLAIVSSDVLATMLARKSSGRIDGFVIEGPLAGGHNAPPRGPAPHVPTGEPVYGERDVPDLERIRELGVPFWLAGSCATAEQLAAARRLGAHGVQVGNGLRALPRIGPERRSEGGAAAGVGGRRGLRAHRSPRLADRHAVQGGGAARHAVGRSQSTRSACAAATSVICDARSATPTAGSAIAARPSPRATSRPRAASPRTRAPHVPVQRPAGDHRPRPAAGLRLRRSRRW